MEYEVKVERNSRMPYLNSCRIIFTAESDKDVKKMKEAIAYFYDNPGQKAVPTLMPKDKKDGKTKLELMTIDHQIISGALAQFDKILKANPLRGAA